MCRTDIQVIEHASDAYNVSIRGEIVKDRHCVVSILIITYTYINE